MLIASSTPSVGKPERNVPSGPGINVCFKCIKSSSLLLLAAVQALESGMPVAASGDIPAVSAAVSAP